MNTQSDELSRRIKAARWKFTAMSVAYFTGVFNDNLFRQSVLLLAVTADKSYIQGYATIIFTLPFIIFAAPAGWCADRFSKRRVVILVKTLELAAMICGAVAVYYSNWILMLATLGGMGLWATIFSPALNGSIPELYPPQYVIKANGIIKMLSTAAILAGIAAAGFVLDAVGGAGTIPVNNVMTGAILINIALAGILVSLGVPKYPAASPKAAFPWQGPLHTLKTLWNIRNDNLLAASIIANAFFWFIGSLEVLLINQLGLSELSLSPSVTSLLIVAELIGLAAGALLISHLAKPEKWYRIPAPACLAMALFLALISMASFLPEALHSVYLISMFVFAGAAAGVFMIPLESFIQVRPPPDRKGAIIAAANFAAFTGILLSGPALNLLDKLGIAPSSGFAIIAVMAAAVAIWLFFALQIKKTYD
jgi:acyl-[acyl-carrier-protein]-phospholipid O-acyltransferase/long-chain-fatty-acid--[acyl-carrier-protein] ligase